MIRLTPSASGTTKVTFVVPTERFPDCVSVVGDFNEWDEHAHPLKKRSNGTRSVSIELPAGERYEYKYLAQDGDWACDEQSELHVLNEYGEVNSVLHT